MLWSQTIEWLGVASGILYVVLAAKQSILCWPVSLLNLSVYFYLFLNNGLYADAGLQIFYLVLTLYGWWHWCRRGQNAEEKSGQKPIRKHSVEAVEGGPPVRSWSDRGRALTLVIIVGVTLALWGVLRLGTDSSVPLLDAHTTAVSLIAQALTTRKILQSWLLWIWANVFYCGLYLNKGLYPTFGLYAFFIVLAVFGYREWKVAFNSTGKTSEEI